MTLVSINKKNIYADIHGGSLGRQFSAIFMAISSETLELRPTLLLYGHKQSVAGL